MSGGETKGRTWADAGILAFQTLDSRGQLPVLIMVVLSGIALACQDFSGGWIPFFIGMFIGLSAGALWNKYGAKGMENVINEEIQRLTKERNDLQKELGIDLLSTQKENK